MTQTKQYYVLAGVIKRKLLAGAKQLTVVLLEPSKAVFGDKNNRDYQLLQHHLHNHKLAQQHNYFHNPQSGKVDMNEKPHYEKGNATSTN